MLSIKALTSLAIVASTALTNVHAQCPQFVVVLVLSLTNLYVVRMRDISVHSTPPQEILLGPSALETTGNTTNYLSVQTFSNTCNGGPVFIQCDSFRATRKPFNRTAPFSGSAVPRIPMFPTCLWLRGVTDCPTAAFMGPAPWAAIAAADGFPHGQYTNPGTTRTTLQGGYNNLKTFCGECMTFALGNAVGRQVLLPQWKDPNSMLATPNVQAYANFYGAVVQQVVWYLSVNTLSRLANYNFIQYLSVFFR
ncbi:hypothetical protein B0H14DRAFT_2640453 [Mycena olivaceomarginata]|nr:hypothetical protein B0H14DRAFT_2640453 [Mycena olivaceomarginata]